MAVLKALLSRDPEQDWKEGSAVPSSVPVASPDVLLGPSLGAELEPGKDTHTLYAGLLLASLLRASPLGL